VALQARQECDAIRRSHVALADVPIVAVEIACACMLLAATAIALHARWVAPAAVTAGDLLLVAARLTHLRFAHRPLAAGLAVLAHARLRVVLAGLVGLVTLVSGARICVLMAVAGLPVTFATVGLVMLSLGVFGLLPLGPSASPAGTVATLGASGSAGLGSALVLGIAISATSICAVAVYAVAAGAAVLAERRGAGRDDAAATTFPFAGRRSAPRGPVTGAC